MKTVKAIATLVLATAIISCSQQGDAQQVPDMPKEISGYGDLEFGMSFNDAMAVVDVSLFSPLSMRGCRASLAIRGCHLLPDSNLTAFETHGGIPYGLTLSFNRFDQLTDVSLKYVRRAINSPDERMELSDCQAILERTIDWVASEYGPFDPPDGDGDDLTSIKTPHGRDYQLFETDGSFVSITQHEFPNERSISLVSSYIVTGNNPSCEIDLQFRDSDQIERWELSPEEQAHYDEVTGGV